MQRQANFWKSIHADTNLTIPNAGKDTMQIHLKLLFKKNDSIQTNTENGRCKGWIQASETKDTSLKKLL
jgi:hypothetical protein